MALTYPLRIERRVERRWHRHVQRARMPQPANENTQGGGRCPICNGPASAAPAPSEYRGSGIIRHHWGCGVCSHQWFTVQRVLV